MSYDRVRQSPHQATLGCGKRPLWEDLWEGPGLVRSCCWLSSPRRDSTRQARAMTFSTYGLAAMGFPDPATPWALPDMSGLYDKNLLNVSLDRLTGR